MRKARSKGKRKVSPHAITDGLWRELERGWQLTPQHKMLVAAGRQAWARWRQLQRLVDKQGVAIPGRYKGTPRMNPLLAAEARARESLVKILAYLDLGEADESDA